jgi:hypothetical protein
MLLHPCRIQCCQLLQQLLLLPATQLEQQQQQLVDSTAGTTQLQHTSRVSGNAAQAASWLCVGWGVCQYLYCDVCQHL